MHRPGVDNEKTPVANEEREPEPDPGVTRMFDVTYRSNSDCTADRLCSQSNADIFCIGLGYEYAVDYHCDKSPHRTYCDPYRVTRRPYLARVTCWKP